MPKYPILKPRELIKALSKLGYYFKSQNGSHAKYTNDQTTLIIPMHTEIAQYTLKGILERADIDIEDFKKLLK